jgi:DNA-binding transcriptional LysR family regulator
MDRLAHMRSFVRVAEAGSFSAAARGLGVSKAVISKHVSALEAYLGVELLRRTTRSLGLTDAGRSYLGRATDLLEELDSLEASVRADAAAVSGLLRVTAPPGLFGGYARALTVGFRARHPEVRLWLDLTHRMVDLVEEGVDLAIRVTQPDESSLIARRLAPCPLVLVAAPEYLARQGSPESPSALARHACLVDMNMREGNRWRFTGDSVRTVVEVDGPYRINSPVEIRELAIAGEGIALCPRFVVADGLRDGRLVELLPGRVATEWAIYAVYPRRRYQPARLRAYLQHLVDVFAGSAD